MKRAPDDIPFEPMDLPLDDSIAFVPLAERLENILGHDHEMNTVCHVIAKSSLVVRLYQSLVVNSGFEL